MMILQRDGARSMIRQALEMLAADYGRADLDCPEIREAHIDEFGEWHDDVSDDAPDGFLVAVRLKSGGSETIAQCRELWLAEDIEEMINEWLGVNE